VPSNYIPPHFTGKRQESICHDEKVAYRPLTILCDIRNIMASNQSCHFQKISQMNMFNAIYIGLTVKLIH